MQAHPQSNTAAKTSFPFRSFLSSELLTPGFFGGNAGEGLC